MTLGLGGYTDARSRESGQRRKDGKETFIEFHTLVLILLPVKA